MEKEPVTQIIGHRIIGTGIICTYGVDRLDDSIIEVIQDHMKNRQEKETIIDVYDNNRIDIHYCGEDALDNIDDYDSETIKIFKSLEEFKSLNDIDKIDRKSLRSHNNGYISRIIY